MAGKNVSSGYYRRKSYRNRRWRKIVIVAVISLVVLFVAFIVVGNLLDEKVENTRDNVKNESNTDTSPGDVRIDHNLKGYALDLKNMSSGDFSQKLSELSKLGAVGVSLRLTDDEGYPIYRSKIAAEFNYGEQDESMLSLDSMFSKITSSTMASGVCITVTSNAETDPKAEMVLSAYESALISEICEAGFRDILICPKKFSIDDISDFCRIAEDVKSINGNAALGIAIPIDVLASSEGELSVNALMQSFDFFAFDLTGAVGEDAVENIDKIISYNLYYILRYNARILLAEPETAELRDAILETVVKNNVNNWQFIS